MKKKKLSISDTILSVILVTDNDSDIIAGRLEKIDQILQSLQTNYELLIVDNNSSDDTIDEIKKLHKKIPHIRILILSKNYDKEIALTAGLDNCIGDAAILFNIYTDPPTMITKLFKSLKENHDIVIATGKNDLHTYDWISRLFLFFIQKFSRHEFVYRTNFLAALNRRAINAIIRTRRKSRNLSYLNNIIGLRKYHVIYSPLSTYNYKISHDNFFELFFSITDIIISNSFKPIRIVTFLGVLSSLLFLIYVFIISMILILFDKHIAPQGWISISSVMGGLFFLLFLLLAFLSEYVIRTLSEARNEPLYFVADEIDKSVILPKKGKLNIV